MSAALEMICAPPGKSGAGSSANNSSSLRPSLRISATHAAATSRRLWLGISVASPTAMPLAPLSSTNGSRAGSCRGSSVEPS